MLIRVQYEVYDKRALHRDPLGLPLLDRDRAYYKAKRSARQWGGVVVRVEYHERTGARLGYVVVYVHTPPRDPLGDETVVTLRELRGRLRFYDRHLYRPHRSRGRGPPPSN